MSSNAEALASRLRSPLASVALKTPSYSPLGCHIACQSHEVTIPLAKMVAMDLQTALTYIVVLTALECSLRALNSCCPALMRIARAVGIAIALLSLELLYCFIDNALPWLLALPLIVLLGVLWTLKRLFRICRKTFPMVVSTLLRVGQLMKPSLLILLTILLTLGAHILIGFGNAYVVKPVLNCCPSVTQVRTAMSLFTVSSAVQPSHRAIACPQSSARVL